MQSNIRLNEICKVSVLRATAALSKFLHTPLSIDINPVIVEKIDDLEFAREFTENTVNLSLPITGNLNGTSFFLYSKQSALALCDILFDRKSGETREFSEMEISALSEVTNILIGNFLTPFSECLQLDCILHRPATYEFEPFKKTFFKQINAMASEGKTSILNIRFTFKHLNIKGYVFIILDQEKIKAILEKEEPVHKD